MEGYHRLKFRLTLAKPDYYYKICSYCEKKLVQPRVCWQVEIFTLFPKEKISDMHLLRYANSILLATKNA